jgi:hypothetical protein
MAARKYGVNSQILHPKPDLRSPLRANALDLPMRLLCGFENMAALL